METLRIDRTKLRTVRSFALTSGVTVQQVYNWIKDKKVKLIEIDGVKFILID
jgi:hypothetical protein